jgi:hypothetical protein
MITQAGLDYKPRLQEAIDALVSASEIVDDTLAGKPVDSYKLQCFNRELDLLRAGFNMGVPECEDIKLYPHTAALVRMIGLAHYGNVKAPKGTF